MPYFIDIHCHPSLKTYLFEGSIVAGHTNLLTDSCKSPEGNILDLSVSLPKMVAGQIRCAWAAHYVPENILVRENKGLKVVESILNILWKRLTNRVEQDFFKKASYDSQSNFLLAQESIKIFEQRVKEAQKQGFNVTIAHSLDELFLQESNYGAIFIHTVEGAHMLGRNLASTDEYIRNLHQFHALGVAMLTLGHFDDNDITHCTQGLPPELQKKMSPSYQIKYSTRQYDDASVGLTQHGIKVVEEMLEIGMIVDLTHSTPAARKQVFDINLERAANGKRLRPIVISHVGIQAKFQSEYQAFNHDKYTNPSDGEIQRIMECNGVIGIIFSQYWLTGKDDSTSSHTDFCIDSIIDTMFYIAGLSNQTGVKKFDHIALGTDLDGFTNPPDDLVDTSYVPRLGKALLRKLRTQYTNADAQEIVGKIFGGNARRVLEEGWSLSMYPMHLA